MKINKSIVIKNNRLNNISFTLINNHNYVHIFVFITIFVYIHNYVFSIKNLINLFVNRIRKNFLLNVKKKIRYNSKICFYCEKTSYFVKNCFYKLIELRFVLLIFILFIFNTFNIFAFVCKMQKNE